jgi:Gram-negative bacterial TonB protein C-terminal
MKLNEHERARPNLAGLMPSGQQAEMKLLLSGAWPPLRPLPVFKYESPEYRASIEFDKARGEWVCRKTFLLSNKVQELRGGLAELAKALPPAHAEAFAQCPTMAPQGQEFAREAGRRLQALLEWKANFENGGLYSDLQRHLSESQQQEIEEVLRLTLTARQLQFSPKNIAYVFDALSKAGGRLATLIESAKRMSAPQAPDPAVNVEAAAPEAVPDGAVANPIPAVIDDSPEEEIVSAFPAQEQPASAEQAAQTASEVTVNLPPGNLDADPSSFFMEHPERVSLQAAVTAARPQVRTHKFEAQVNRAGNFPSRQRALEISGFQIAAVAVVFLFAVISLPIGLTVGRGPLGQWFRDAQQSLFAAHVAQPPMTEHPVAETPKSSAPLSPVPIVDSDHSSKITTPGGAAALSEETLRESSGDSESSIEAPATISNSPPAPESRLLAHSDAISGRDGSAGQIARVAPPPAMPEPVHSFKDPEPITRGWKNHASSNFAPSIGSTPHRSTPSGILVTTPAHGSKPFRVNFPEKPIAASSSFAMASELSVLVPPGPGSSAAHRSSRLRAGELAYFVWPRYSRQGERYGSAETVRVRATVGQLGQVLDIKLLSGSAALFPAARNAVHLWRYRPTLLNNRPIAVQQDITIEFRPPQYLSQVRTQHPSHN